MAILDTETSVGYHFLERPKCRIGNELRKEIKMSERIGDTPLNVSERNILSERVFAITATIAEAFSCIERLWSIISHEEISTAGDCEFLAFFCTASAVVGETGVAIFFLEVF